ncbi:MAG: sugar ABC transporter substrate-binding protein [Pseudomonadota bacterium]
MKNLLKAACVSGLALAMPAASTAEEVTIATVNNGHMIVMQRLAGVFVNENPGVELNWITLDEGSLRSRVTQDILQEGGQFDIMTIGMYEAPIWGSRGWLEPLNFSAAYDTQDILPAIRDGLSHDGQLYAAPFYGESSMIMYRADLVRAAGLSIQDNPSWTEIRQIAAAIHNPDDGVYGICLRGKPGWGDNMAFITTLANSFGAQWFNMDWTPALDSPEWTQAIDFYVDLLNSYGPPAADTMSFNEILSLFNAGRCGMWIDATIAASFVSDPGQSSVANQVAFAQAPRGVTTKGANWLWAWALAIPAGSENAEGAKRFIEWATSKGYIQLVGAERGWGAVPTGTRVSTYENPAFRAAATFDEAELSAILSANPNDSTLNPSPYTGVQFAAIPEFQSIGTAVAEQMSAALRGDVSVRDALAASQAEADRQMRAAGYY